VCVKVAEDALGNNMNTSGDGAAKRDARTAVNLTTSTDDGAAPAKRSSFSEPVVSGCIAVEDSPDSVVARGGLEEPPNLNLPKAVVDDRIVWLSFGKRTRSYLLCAVVFAALHWLPILCDGFAKVVQADAATLIGVLLAGFVAQLVDGVLGMGYGLTSSSVLVAAGLSPVVASQAVHLAQLGTTLLSGLSHHSCGTVDWPTTWCLALPGVGGALVGACLLTMMPVTLAKTMSSALLLTIGAYLAARFYAATPSSSTRDGTSKPRLLLLPIGTLGGFVDVAAGGGWGPVATSGLLAEGRLPPRQCIGTVSMSEFFVTVAAVCGFALSSGHSLDSAGGMALRMDLMGALLAGGLLAAPLAPLLVVRMPSNLLGVVIGGFICLSNARVLLRAADVAGHTYVAVLTAMAILWAGASARVALVDSAKRD